MPQIGTGLELCINYRPVLPEPGLICIVGIVVPALQGCQENYRGCV